MKRVIDIYSNLNWGIIFLATILMFTMQSSLALPSSNKDNNAKRGNAILSPLTDKNNTVKSKNIDSSHPYVGFQAGYISEMMKPIYSLKAFRRGYGSSCHQKNPMLYGLFFGKDLNNSVSVELGYETQHKKNRIAELSENDTVPGLVGYPLRAGDHIVIGTTDRTEYWNADLKIKFKEYDIKGYKNSLVLWGKIGVSYAQIRAVQDIIADETGFFTPAERVRHTRSFKNKKLIPTAQVGLDYSLSKNFSLRTFCGLKNLRLLKAKPKENPTGNSEIKLRDGIQASLALIYKL